MRLDLLPLTTCGLSVEVDAFIECEIRCEKKRQRKKDQHDYVRPVMKKSGWGLSKIEKSKTGCVCVCAFMERCVLIYYK